MPPQPQFGSPHPDRLDLGQKRSQALRQGAGDPPCPAAEGWKVVEFFFLRPPPLISTYKKDTKLNVGYPGVSNLHILQIGDITGMSTNSIVPFTNVDLILVN